MRTHDTAFSGMRSSRGYHRFKEWMVADRSTLAAEHQQHLDAALGSSSVLEKVYAFKKELMATWERSTVSKEELVANLEDWCKRAEASGILALQQFSRKLRAYA